MGVVRRDGDLSDHCIPLPVEKRSNTHRSDVDAVSDFRVHSAGQDGDRPGARRARENLTQRAFGEDFAKSRSNIDAFGDWHLSALYLSRHKLGWATDLGTTARHFNPGSFSQRGLNGISHRNWMGVRKSGPKRYNETSGVTEPWISFKISARKCHHVTSTSSSSRLCQLSVLLRAPACKNSNDCWQCTHCD